MSGKQRDPEVSPHEAAASRADDERERRLGRQGVDVRPRTIGSTFRRSRWVRSASPWCGNVTITRRPWRTIAASSFSASASPRAAMAGRCASKTCGCERGSASSRAAPSTAGASSPSSRHTPTTSSSCQTRSGGRSSSGTRSPSSSASTASSGSPYARSRAGKTTDSSTAWSARCVNGENARICSMSSPKNSTRSGSRPVLGKMSTRPPRTAICPRSSTRSTRS